MAGSLKKNFHGIFCKWRKLDFCFHKRKRIRRLIKFVLFDRMAFKVSSLLCLKKNLINFSILFSLTFLQTLLLSQKKQDLIFSRTRRRCQIVSQFLFEHVHPWQAICTQCTLSPLLNNVIRLHSSLSALLSSTYLFDNSTAVSNPMPQFPPVITTTFPSQRVDFRKLFPWTKILQSAKVKINKRDERRIFCSFEIFVTFALIYLNRMKANNDVAAI